MNDPIKTHCQEVEKEFVDKMLPMPFVARGILASEGFAFCAIAKQMGVDLIIESGVYEGQSTYIWSKFFSDSKIIAIDKDFLPATIERFSSIHNVDFWEGDGYRLLPELIQKNPDKKIAIFIDGPKGMRAIDLAVQCFKYDNVMMVGLHDFHTISKNKKLGNKAPNVRRTRLDDSGVVDLYTDDSEFVRLYSYMDSVLNFTGQGDEDLYWTPYWLMSKTEGKFATFGSYGPTIAFIIRK